MKKVLIIVVALIALLLFFFLRRKEDSAAGSSQAAAPAAAPSTGFLAPVSSSPGVIDTLAHPLVNAGIGALTSLLTPAVGTAAAIVTPAAVSAAAPAVISAVAPSTGVLTAAAAAPLAPAAIVPAAPVVAAEASAGLGLGATLAVSFVPIAIVLGFAAWLGVFDDWDPNAGFTLLTLNDEGAKYAGQQAGSLVKIPNTIIDRVNAGDQGALWSWFEDQRRMNEALAIQKSIDTPIVTKKAFAQKAGNQNYYL